MPGQQEPDPETERRVHKIEKDVTAAVDETSSIEDIGDADGEGDIVRLIRKTSTACAVRQLAQCSCKQVSQSSLCCLVGRTQCTSGQTAWGVCCPISSTVLLRLQEQASRAG